MAFEKGNKAAVGRRDSWRNRVARKIEERLDAEGDKLPADQFLALIRDWARIKLPERSKRA